MNSTQILRDRYKVVKSLQSGGMGAVFLAEDISLGNSLCAVKQMHNLGLDSEQYLRSRFESEMLALVQLQHPGIPRVRDYFQQDTSVFLVMDFIQGATLDEEIQNQARQGTTAPLQDAVRDMLQVLEVLDYMHSQSPPVLHRDIKPANLIREALSGKIKVVDFGLARSVEVQGETSHTQVGTLGYSAIEQLSGQAQIRSDLYSVGVTLHQLVTGLRPSLAGVIPLTPQVMPQWDRELADIIMRAAQPDPEGRYTSAHEMKQALSNWLQLNSTPQNCLPDENNQARSITDSRTPSKVDPVAPTPSRPFLKPHGRPLFLAVVGLLVTLGLLSNRWWPGRAAAPLDTGLKGDIFSYRIESNAAAVTLGEDVGLFQVLPSANRSARERSEIVVRRLNNLYHHRCGSCGNLTLEPHGIRIGRVQGQGVDEVVLFYAHLHGEQWIYGPELLATADLALAARSGATPRNLAGYWRELMRDVVTLSRGQSSTQSPLGTSLMAFLNQARAEQKPGTPTIANLKAVLKRLPNRQAKELQKAFLTVPEEFSFEADAFPEYQGYKPLTI